MRNALEEHEIFGAVFATPATPKNHCIVRLSVNARLRDPDLERVISACASIARERAIDPWPKGLTAQAGDTLVEAGVLDAREKTTDSAVAALRQVGRDLQRAADRWFDRSL